jgi:hypothetical protein
MINLMDRIVQKTAHLDAIGCQTGLKERMGQNTINPCHDEGHSSILSSKRVYHSPRNISRGFRVTRALRFASKRAIGVLIGTCFAHISTRFGLN